MTDFVVGETYQLKQPAWIRRGTLLTLRGKEPADSEGVLPVGTRLTIRKVEVLRGPEHGTTTEVYAEVSSGKHQGKLMNVSVISKRMKNGYTKRDAEMLEAVPNASK